MFKNFVLTTLSFLLFTVSYAQEEDHSVFIQEDWNKALELAKESGKPILVDFYTEWCGWCKVMDKKTFSVPSISEKIAADYIAVRLDAERGIGKMVAAKYRVSSYPTIGYFTSEGKLMGKISGYITADKFPDMIDSMAKYNVLGSDRFPAIGDELEPGFPEFYYNSFSPNGERTSPKADELEKWYSENPKWDTEVYFSIFFKFYWQSSDKIKSEFMSNRARYTEMFGKQEVSAVMNRLISSRFYKTVKSKDRKAFDQLLAELPNYIDDPLEVKEMGNNLKLSFYNSTKDFKKLTKEINDMYVRGVPPNEGSINTYAWNMYEHCDNNKCLSSALVWMKKVVEKESNYAYEDTYAAIAYKLDKYDIAKEYAEKAIATGKTNEEDVKATEELLANINKAIAAKE
ncbi:MAG: hypothetical protein COA58_02735 [Bacteroidetes bacterium]|nr:MAG: hypothetical protein COA58_02735 [Bacteroidota bacterium]